MNGLITFLVGLGQGALRLGQTVADTFRDVLGFGEQISKQPIDATELKSALEDEQLRQVAELEPEAQEVKDWFTDQTLPPPNAVYEPTARDVIKQYSGTMDHPYRVQIKLQDPDGSGTHGVSLWYDHNPTPGEIAADLEKWLPIYVERGSRSGQGSMNALEYEVIEDQSNADWTP
jgi:hypothetical protein